MKTIQEIADQIRARGNDVEIRGTRDGIKVYEVKRKLVALIEDGKKEEKA